MLEFDKIRVNIECPVCKFPNQVSMRVIRFGLTLLCRGCKARIRLVTKGGSLDKAKRHLEALQSALSKTISIKL